MSIQNGDYSMSVTLWEINEASPLHWYEWFSWKAKVENERFTAEGLRCFGFGNFYVVAKQTSSKECSYMRAVPEALLFFITQIRSLA